MKFFFFDRPLLTSDWKSESVTYQPTYQLTNQRTYLLTWVGARDTYVSKNSSKDGRKESTLAKWRLQNNLIVMIRTDPLMIMMIAWLQGCMTCGNNVDPKYLLHNFSQTLALFPFPTMMMRITPNNTDPERCRFR